jgi:hypothetical protein
MATSEHVQMWIPKKRVPVEIHMITGDLLHGAIYADARRLDGSRGRVVDRLNDRSETFLPVATEDRHVLLRKAGIVSVHVTQGDSSVVVSEGVAEFSVRIGLATGEHLRGRLYALLPPAHGRTLDLLNKNRDDFISFLCDHDLALLNTEHIVSVTEESEGASQ